MKRMAVDWCLAVLAITSLSCLVSLMVQFMGGAHGGADLQGLVAFQASVAPLALGIFVFNVYRFVGIQGWAKGIRELWRAIPQWLVFVFLMLNSLVLFGEAAYVIVMHATDRAVLWHEHVPLVCILICSSAYLVLYARAHWYPGSPPAMSGRWTQP